MGVRPSHETIDTVDPRLAAIDEVLRIEKTWGLDEANIPMDEIHSWRTAQDLLGRAYVDYTNGLQRHDEEPPRWVEDAVRRGIPLELYGEEVKGSREEL